MSIYEHINSPEDLRRLRAEDLPALAEEMRLDMIDAITETGGHMGSGLGVLELTIALHYVFDLSRDRLVFDVGHQCYPHKMLTGRKDRMRTMRMTDGLCGFPHPDESDYDLFHTGHAGTSISLALGLAVADKLAGNDRRTVAVIGDAGFGAGVAFEAMNHASETGANLLVILNDNEMSISKTVGAMTRYFSRLRTGPLYTGAKRELHELIKHIPLVGEKMERSLQESLDVLRSTVAPGNVFQELGFDYFGPMDGHDLPRLVHSLSDFKARPGLTLLHLLTRKGAGHADEHSDPSKLHGVKPTPAPVRKPDHSGEADPPAGAKPPARPAYTNVFADALAVLAGEREDLVAVTAAMPDGTGLSRIADQLGDRLYDVGICEQHAVAFAGGLAKGAKHPVVAIYSTFLQRGYDMVFQELAIQDAPCVLAMDRAGLVDDGATHHGLFDIAYLRTLPNTTLLAPASAEELEVMLAWACNQNGVVGIRYPRDAAPAATGPMAPIERGRAVTVRKGEDVALVAYGTMVPVAEAAAALLAEQGVEAAVVNARFAKPVDGETIARVIGPARLLVTLEEHSVRGGFGAAVLEELAARGTPIPATLQIGVPDQFVEHGTRADLIVRLGLTAPAVAARIMQTIGTPVGASAL